MLIVGATDPRVKCIVSVVPVVEGYQTMRRDHGELRFADLIERITEDRRKRSANPEDRGHIPMSSRTPQAELCSWPFPEVTEVFENLQKTDAPNHRHFNTVESVELLMQYTVFPYTPRLINTPLMMIVADGDNITSWDLEVDAFRSVPSERKELVVLPKTTHMSLYSQQLRLEMAGSAGARWFQSHL